jgi:exo-1,4-beta-D-glucosaminidase
LNRRYGTATSLEDYERKAQASAYDNQRSMFEAYGRNKYVATGVIQWMLNNAWPSVIWHLYDYYLVPGGGYFGTKKAQEVIHVQYDYTTNSVSVVNGTYAPLKGLKVSAKLFHLDSKEAAAQDATMDVDADAAAKALDLHNPGGLSTTYFLKLQLHDSAGKPISDNFYWLSTKPDTMDWANKKDTVYTPQKEFGDLTGLNTLPNVKLEVKPEFHYEAGKGTIHLKIKNSSASVAFQIHLRLANSKDNDDIVPIFWDDNYFSLLPGEEKSVSATYDASDAAGKEPVLEVGGFNITSATIKFR